MDPPLLKVNHSSVSRYLKLDKIKASYVLAQQYEVSWVTDDRLRFSRNAFDLENANQKEDHPDDVEDEDLAFLSDAQDNDLRI
nr:unnamed protein product [Callosobruchus analis]